MQERSCRALCLLYFGRVLCVRLLRMLATSVDELGKLAKVLGVPPGELIEEVPDDIQESNK